MLVVPGCGVAMSCALSANDMAAGGSGGVYGPRAGHLQRPRLRSMIVCEQGDAA